MFFWLTECEKLEGAHGIRFRDHSVPDPVSNRSRHMVETSVHLPQINQTLRVGKSLVSLWDIFRNSLFSQNLWYCGMTTGFGITPMGLMPYLMPTACVALNQSQSQFYFIPIDDLWGPCQLYFWILWSFLQVAYEDCKNLLHQHYHQWKELFPCPPTFKVLWEEPWGVLHKLTQMP